MRKGEGKRFERDKGTFAERVLPLITKEGVANTLDLKDRIEEACKVIRRWNGLPEAD